MEQVLAIYNGNEKFPITAWRLYSRLYGTNMKHFLCWCNQNIKNKVFVSKDVDYKTAPILFELKRTRRVILSDDYWLTIDFAKELCILPNNPKSKYVNDQLIAYEKTEFEKMMQKTATSNNLSQVLFKAAKIAKQNEEYDKEKNESYELDSYLHVLEISYSVN